MTGAELYEVELKFPIVDADAVSKNLARLGARWSEPVPQTDIYFGHPARNFKETDEALRMRTVGESSILTYKGPVIDRATKTRREIEADLTPGAAAASSMTQILEHLGFFRVREVAKVRRAAEVIWQSRPVTCGWDEVAPIGTYLELEIVTDVVGKSGAQALIIQLAAHLQLGPPEPRSYLEMLLQRDDAVQR